MENKNDDQKKPETAGALVPIDQVKVVRPAEYLRTAKAHVKGGRQKAAFSVLQQAVVHYPENPYLLSYYGYLQALVDKKYRSGVENCKKALTLSKHAALSGEEGLYPVLFLNLGRAFVAAGKKKDAVDAFQKGLKYDGRNSELLKEVRGLGVRKKPPIPFLDRANPINKYIGKALNPSGKDPAKKK
jgi:tetratricopeptide (TPR) repeat protein